MHRCMYMKDLQYISKCEQVERKLSDAQKPESIIELEC